MDSVGDDKRGRSARRTRIAISGCAIAIALFVSLVTLKPRMPEQIQLLTGPEGSAYHDLGLLYAAELARRGLEVELIETAGALDNLERLTGGASNAVAFVPTTLDFQSDAKVDGSRLVSLGSVGFDPLWLFFRSDLAIERIPDLAHRVVATGGEDTVSHHVAGMLIEYSGITADVQLLSMVELSAESMADQIVSGELDALFVTGRADSSGVAPLLARDGVSFLSFERAAAYAARIRGIAGVTLPEGVLDLARNLPAQESHLLTAFTGLAARDDLHPEVAPQFLSAASGIEAETSFLSPRTTFPSAENQSLPLDRSAKRYFDQGEVGLSKYLPYKVVRWLNHLGFVVLPLLTLVALLLKVVPLALRIYGSARLKMLLKRMEAVEKGHAAGQPRAKLLADLDSIDAISTQMFVPRSCVHDYIDVRQFLHDMRERVER